MNISHVVRNITRSYKNIKNKPVFYTCTHPNYSQKWYNIFQLRELITKIWYDVSYKLWMIYRANIYSLLDINSILPDVKMFSWSPS